MRLSKKLALIVTAIVIVVAGLLRYLFVVPDVEAPVLEGRLQESALTHDGLERSFSYYVPRGLGPGATVVLSLHGSRGSGARIRQATGFAFDVLADRHGFIVVYPDAYEGHWNDCRAVGDYAARRLDVDDVGFIRRVLDVLQERESVDLGRVFSMGLSGGGQMSLRLGIELPEIIRGAVAIAANMPAPRNLVCEPSDAAVALMLINGTDDPINPYDGGEVSMLGRFGRRGAVLSSLESAELWAERAGHASTPFQHRYPDAAPDDGSVATRMVWADPGRPEVSLVTVHGGGHTIPLPEQPFPRFLGATNRDFSAADEIWRFFQRELERLQ